MARENLEGGGGGGGHPPAKIGVIAFPYVTNFIADYGSNPVYLLISLEISYGTTRSLQIYCLFRLTSLLNLIVSIISSLLIDFFLLMGSPI